MIFQYKGYFFDFDGVLADSVEVKTRAFAKLFEQYGQEIKRKVVEHHMENGGMSRFEKFRYYYREFIRQPLTDDKLDRLCERFAKLVVDEVVAAPEIIGVRSFLEKCHLISPCFVVSATPEVEIREIVRRRGLRKFFLDVLGAPLSKQENIERLLEDHNLAPERCMFFGDAESDYLAAMECGVHFIGILPDEKSSLLRVASQIEWYKNFSELRA